MRVWVDITAASQVVFMAPIVRRLEDAGHIVTITARRFAGADLLLRRYGFGAVLMGRHRGGGIGTRAVGLVNRTAQLLGSASSGRYDVAVGGHASDFVLTAWTLGIPQLTLLDDDRTRGGNLVNVRLVDEIAVPEAMPAAALAALWSAAARSCSRTRGSRRSTTSGTYSPTPTRCATSGVEPRRIVGVVRPPRPARERRRRRLTGRDNRWRRSSATSPPARNVTLVVAARDADQQRRFASLGAAQRAGARSSRRRHRPHRRRRLRARRRRRHAA